MPAGILPPKRVDAFPGIQSRFLEPRSEFKREYVPPKPETYETQHQWNGTHSRYLDEKKAHAAPKPPDANDPLGGWREAEQHRQLSARSIGNIPSRYAEDAEAKAHPDKSPRDLIERKTDQRKLETSWRGTHALNRHTTFDVLYNNFLKKHRDEKFMQRKRNTSRSPVMDYVRNGTPIEGTSRGGVSPQRGGGGGGGGMSSSSRGISPTATELRRSQSPWVRSQSPDTFLAGRWRGSGVTSTSFSTLQKQTMKLRPQYAYCEQHAAEVVEAQREKKVDQSFVPRVAKLALVYQIPESLRSQSRGSYEIDEHHGGDHHRTGSRSPERVSPTRRLSPRI